MSYPKGHRFPASKGRSSVERFMEKVSRSGECLLWIGSKDGCGYGMFYLDGKIVRAHRFNWERINGPIPAGMVTDHLCRVRACVDPDHIELVTPRENTLRGYGVGMLNAAKTECQKGHPFVVSNLVKTGNGTRRCRTCCREESRARRRRSA